MFKVKFSYHPLELEHFSTLAEKFDALKAYLEIRAIFCHLEDEEIDLDLGTKKYTVLEIIIPGGQASYIKSLVTESLQILEDSLESYIHSEHEHVIIRQTLELLKEKSIALVKKFDMHTSLGFDEYQLKCIVTHPEGNFRNLYVPELIFTPLAQKTFADHFFIRKEFYQTLIEIIDKKLTWHLEFSRSNIKKPYSWKGENATLEIAELAYALFASRIIIKKEDGGSFAKFLKEFFNLFGYNDEAYHAKMQQVRNRVTKTSWLEELPRQIESSQKANKTTKNKP